MRLKLWIIIDNQDTLMMAFCRKERAEQMLSQMPNATNKFGLTIKEIETIDNIKEEK